MGILVHWKGIETMANVRETLKLHKRAVIELPPHQGEALTARMQLVGDGAAGEVEVSGGPELLRRFTDGTLANLAPLHQLASEFHAEVRINAAGPVIRLLVPDAKHSARLEGSA